MTFFNGFSLGGNHICGCYYVPGPQRRRCYLPQVKLASHTTLGPLYFTTRLTQTFRNSSDATIPEARYTFPLYDGVAVSGYAISYGDKVLKGVVKQKDDARKTYDQAIERGETAGLLEALPVGVFGVTIGNLLSGVEVVVEITYCGELKHDAGIDGLRYTLPTAIAPRYGEYPGELLGGNGQVTGGIRITVDVDLPASTAVRRLQSPSHPISVTTGCLSSASTEQQHVYKPHHASATLTLGTTGLGADFVLQLLTTPDLNTPRAVLEIHPSIPNQRAIMATLVPRFTLPPAYPEIVFIADQSGSMSGAKNTALKQAMNVFLKSLPLGVRFNICTFGNRHKFLWVTSQAYNEANVGIAMQFVENLRADMGGTEILAPIRAAFEQSLDGMPLEVVVVTDGQVWQEKAVTEYVNMQVRERQMNARVFALGIGNGVSTTLVEGIARAGNGTAQFVGEGEKGDEVAKKVVRMLKGALYAHTGDYKIEVQYAEDKTEDEETVLTPAAEEGDDDFELIEKFSEDPRPDEKPPAYGETDAAVDGADKPAKSFFDASVDLDAPSHDQEDRYAHLPSLAPPDVLQAPAEIPPFFPYSRTAVYLLLGPETPQKKISAIVLHARSDEGPLELTVPVDYVQTTNNVPTVHQLAARKAIQDLEESRGWLHVATTPAGDFHKALPYRIKYAGRFDEMIEREAVQLGERYQVAGKWTSWVATEKRDGMEEQQATNSAQRHAYMEASVQGHLQSAPGAALHSMMADALAKGESFDACRSAGGHALVSRPAQFRPPIQTRSAGLLGGISSAASSLFGSSSSAAAPGTQATSFGASGGGALFGNAVPSPPRGNFSGVPPPPPPPPPPPGAAQGRVCGFPPPPPLSCAAPPPRPSHQMAQHAPAPRFRFAAPPPPPPARASAAAATQINITKQYAQEMSEAASMPLADDDDDEAMSPGRDRTPVLRSVKMPLVLDRADQDRRDAMHKLISLQTFSGAWLWDKALRDILHTDDGVLRLWQSYPNTSTAVKATALVVAYLKRECSGEKEVWDMVVSKAIGWLAQETKLGADKVDLVVQEAGKRLAAIENDW